MPSSRATTRRRRRVAPSAVLVLALAATASAFSLNPRAAIATYTNSTSTYPAISSASTVGRYGHAAVLLEASSTLLFIGGQVGTNGTTITSSVLSFNLLSSLLWGDRPVSAIPDNPASSDLSTNLPPHAWAATTFDTVANKTWVIGGVTEDCSQDALAYTLGTSASSWDAVIPTTVVPPRRRQAQSIPVFNLTTGGTDIYVFGGIADPYTCSEQLIGYAGIDRWDTVGGGVESFKWNATGEIAVSDYTATLLDDLETVVIVGGQTATGDLVDMSSVLVFNTELREWQRKTVSGDAPTPRMGHIAVALDSGSILIHGGLSSSHTPLATSYLLTPPSDLSYYSTGTWTWTELVISNDSIDQPALSWHSGTLIPDGSIVVAFGIDSTGSPSSEFYFLTIDEDTAEYSYTQTFGGMSTTQIAIASTYRKSVFNPKVNTSGSSTTSASSGGDSPTIVYTGTAGASASSASSAVSSSSIGAATPASSSLTASELSAASGNSSSSKEKTIAASVVGSIAGIVALLAVGGFAYRRYSAKKEGGVRLMVGDGGAGGMREAPLVSTLMFTRPVARRVLSLGSTVSTVDQSPDLAGGDSSAEGSDGHGATLGYAKDPFSDDFMVNEVGQLGHPPEPSGSLKPLPAATMAVSPQLSVRSIPFLNTILQTTPKSEEDSFTQLPVPARSRSIRSAQRRQKSIAEGLDSIMDLASSASAEWDAMDSPSETGAEVGRRSSTNSIFSTGMLPFPGDAPAMPAVVHRPRTPLRVTNADDAYDGLSNEDH